MSFLLKVVQDVKLAELTSQTKFTAHYCAVWYVIMHFFEWHLDILGQVSTVNVFLDDIKSHSGWTPEFQDQNFEEI